MRIKRDPKCVPSGKQHFQATEREIKYDFAALETIQQPSDRVPRKANGKDSKWFRIRSRVNYT